MNSTVNFIVESGISLALLSVVYVLFLRKETFFRLNRLFLLGSVLFSVVLPFFRFRVYEPQSVMLSEITVTPYSNLMETVTVYGHDFTITVEQAVLSASLLIWIYLVGLALFMGMFLVRLIRIGKIVRTHEVQKLGRIKLVLLKNEGSPYSFLNYVFVNRSLQNEDGYDRMLAHEMEHVKQGHSFDVLILEILTVFQWFNPFMWMLRHAIRENHEYLADRAVLGSGVNRGYYKKLLLNQFAGGQLVLTNNFNYSLIKNRIKMMSKIKSSKIANLKIVLGFLTAVLLIIVFACEQKETAEVVAPLAEPDELKITFLDDKLKIAGEAEGLDKLKSIMAGSEEFSLESDSMGNLLLVKKEVVAPKQLSADEQIFFIVEDMPEFPGGELELRKYIANNIKYPVTAQEKGIQGRVYVTFVVDTKGNTANARIARGVDPALDQEALRVVNTLPAWKPGMQKGIPVNVSYTVPINFVLQ
ncbi:outer membrane transport energization protein TonB [Mariniphaga anaerophila]|uniref:Outer membrane transport energization protein TonB n=1 Tax=Mariniphaga anaerophila TaxID=1484053 RepID=A0A1M4T1I6_9BACT|nr:M56 family metallopeptidase [Mariniphaga anaerophila]SHE38265.1 outer membrane transport energization protein TonB [Mariniphaga anaerophila]